MKENQRLYTNEELESLINSNQFPLLNNRHIDELDSPSTQKALFEKIENTSLELSDYPKFKNITSEDIIKLRLFLHLGQENSKLDNWHLKLLRYIEINLPKLKKNEKKHGRSNKSSILIFQQIKALFVEYYLTHNDLIYLNTAIKITDLKWATPLSETPYPIKELNSIKNRQIEYILKDLVNG